MKLGFNYILLVSFFLLVVSLPPLSAQTYTYTSESFESGWPTSAQTTSVASSTGTWVTTKGYSTSGTAQAGSRYLRFDNSGTFQTPELTSGAGILTFWAYASSTSRTVTINTSTDGTTWTAFSTTATLSTTGWQLYTVSINSTTAKYIQFSNGSNVFYDNVLITSLSFLGTPASVSGLDYVVGTGPSPSQSFNFYATNLTAGTPITITAPTNFEVSLDGVTWANTATLPNTAGGTLAATTVYTRVKAGLSVNSYSGNITITGGGKTLAANVAVSGRVSSSTPTPTCNSGTSVPIVLGFDDFGTFSSLTGASCNSYVSSAFTCTSGNIGDGKYGVVASPLSNSGGWGVTGPDHTSSVTPYPSGTFGAMLMVNCGNTATAVIYSRDFTVCSGADLEMSAWYADANKHTNDGYPNAPNVTFTISGKNASGTFTNIGSATTSPPYVLNGNAAVWHELTYPFNSGTYTTVRLVITNNLNETDGNDLLIDDISFTAYLPIQVCVTNPTCNGLSNGAITASRSSGSATYKYLLDGANLQTGTSATYSSISSGTHTVKVQDATSLCAYDVPVIVNQPPALAATATTLPCGAGSGTGSIKVLATGGTPGYQYSSTGTGGPWGTSSTFTNLSDGSYTINVKDAYGCTGSSAAAVSCTLPVNWISFTGIEQGNSFVLNWITSGNEGKGFTIERSINGIDFEELGTVHGKENAADIQSYLFEDLHPKEGINYYRIKQVDNDNTYTYSKIISYNRSQEDLVQIYPNPNNGEFTINVQTQQKDVRIDVVDVEGRVILKKSQTSFPLTLDLSSISKAIYFVRLYTDEKIIIKKLLIF